MEFKQKPLNAEWCIYCLGCVFEVMFMQKIFRDPGELLLNTTKETVKKRGAALSAHYCKVFTSFCFVAQFNFLILPYLLKVPFNVRMFLTDLSDLLCNLWLIINNWIILKLPWKCTKKNKNLELTRAPRLVQLQQHLQDAALLPALLKTYNVTWPLIQNDGSSSQWKKLQLDRVYLLK